MQVWAEAQSDRGPARGFLHRHPRAHRRGRQAGDPAVHAHIGSGLEGLLRADCQGESIAPRQFPASPLITTLIGLLTGGPFRVQLRGS